MFNNSFLRPANVSKIVGWVAKSVDPDQMPRVAQTCLSEYVVKVRKFDRIDPPRSPSHTSPPSEIILDPPLCDEIQ